MPATALVGYGAMLNAALCLAALFRTLPEWQWWLMWAPPVAGLVGMLLAVREFEDDPYWQWLLWLGLQPVLGVPALLLWAGDATAV